MTTATLASGKGHRDENFPVASVLLRREHRAPVMAFYRFARAADDVADHPSMSAADKVSRLAEMRRGLAGKGDDPDALALARVMAERRLDAVHAHELLEAFVQDVTVRRYRDWDALMRYCRLSAMPVGRFVLDVHGESRGLWPANDALCAALQVINHLQDCGQDYRALARAYVPADVLADPTMLGRERATPQVRSAIVALAARASALLAESAGFARAIRDRRLAAEVAVIQRLAEDLARRLLTRDPLAERVHHRRGEAAWLAARAVLAHAAGRRG